MAALLAGFPGSPWVGKAAGQGSASPEALRDVARIRIPGGPELWVAEVPGVGPIGMTFVLPGGADGSGGPHAARALAAGVEARCPASAPVPGAGADYETLSLTVTTEDEVTAALGCVEAALRGVADARSDTEGAMAATPARAAASPVLDLQAYRTASGVLLTTLYAPAPVPGGSFGGVSGDSRVVAPSHLIVVGPVDGGGLERRAEAAFGNGPALQDQGPSSARQASPAVPNPPVSTEVLVLERAGQARAELRVGRLVIPGDHPDWPALVLAREILADRLQGGPWAFAELLRVRGPGAFIAGSRLPVDVVPDALDLLRSEMELLGNRLPSEEELRTATTRLAGSFAVATAGTPALAEELARVAALGLGPEAVRGYPERLAALTPDAVRRAAREYLDPGSLVIAVAGDGAALSRGLDRFGPVRTVTPPAPPSEWPGLTVDGGILSPWVGRYRVRIGGQEVGTAEREVVRVTEDRVWLRTVASIGEGELTQELEATLPGVTFVAGTTFQAGRASGSLHREGDRIIGSGSAGVRVELIVPPETVVADLLEPTLWASELQVGSNHRISVSTPGGAGLGWAAVQVVGRDTITVPAGTFRTFRVVVTGPEILTLWLMEERPHRTVRLLGANGVVLELAAERIGGR